MARILGFESEDPSPPNSGMVAHALEDRYRPVCAPNVLPSSGSLRLARSARRPPRTDKRLGEMAAHDDQAKHFRPTLQTIANAVAMGTPWMP
eukprot:5775247-Pyramimonas_sp.AAC.1